MYPAYHHPMGMLKIVLSTEMMQEMGRRVRIGRHLFHAPTASGTMCGSVVSRNRLLLEVGAGRGGSVNSEWNTLGSREISWDGYRQVVELECTV